MTHEAGSALPSILEHCRADLMRFLVARTGDRDEAEDILQEVWIRAQAQQPAAIEHWRAYLFRTAHHLVIDRIRAARRREARELRWSEDMHGPITADAEVADPAPRADEAAEGREEAARLASAIANLPDGARRAFELHKLEGLSHGEIAAQLGISKSGVEKHMAVAMKHLRRMLAD
ncbi:MAG: RNA polymerase sigma factor [Sphingomonas sp.]